MGKPRKLPYQIITPEEVVLAGQPYELLAEVRAENHFDCVEARIALAWKKGTKPDIDGRLVLGRCVLLNALAREMVPFDYVIVLNREVWEDPEFTRAQKLALLDHEMSHTAPALDAEGDKVRDTKGRLCWRTRGHDIEEFRGIVERHGTYKRDLEKFAEALLRRKKEPLFSGGGVVPATDPIIVGEQPFGGDGAHLANDPAFLAAADRMASTVGKGGFTSLTISTPGMEPVVIDQAAAERIHARATEAKRRTRKKDPG